MKRVARLQYHTSEVETNSTLSLLQRAAMHARGLGK